MAKTLQAQLSDLDDVLSTLSTTITALNAKVPALIASRMPVSIVEYGSVAAAGDTVLYTPTIYVPLSAVDISSEATLYTPNSGKTFHLMGLYLSLDVDGDVTFKKASGGATLLVITFKTGVPTPLLTFGNGLAMNAANALFRAIGPADANISGYFFGRET